MHLKIRPLRLLENIFPVVRWIRNYNRNVAIADAIAGFTVALTLIPQSIAYASLAGLDAQYGLYSSLTGGVVYLLLGTCPEINIGPTALLSLLTFTYTNGTNADMAVLLCFLAGVVQLIAGITRLGFLVDFVSTPVVSGFTSASALIIACSQIKGLLGLTYSAEKFVDVWEKLYEYIYEVRMPDALLSLSCCTILLLLRQMKDFRIKSCNKDDTKKDDTVGRLFWFISVGRNAAVVILCTIIAYLFQDENGYNHFKLTGNIESGLPSVQWPPFSTTSGNETYSFGEMVHHMSTGIVVVPLIGIIANVAIAKAFVKGTKLDATQEMVALGICNLVGSLVGSYPANGSFSRSAVSNASGVRTPAAGLYTSVIVLLTLCFLTPYFYYIPKAALSSVIICAVVFMIDIKIIKDLWISKSRLDLLPLFGTIIACLLLDIAYGVLVGISIDLVILLFYSARPKVRVDNVTLADGATYAIITPTGGLFFPSANHIRDVISKKILRISQKLAAVVIDCRDLHTADWTTVQCIKTLVDDFKANDIRILFLNIKTELLSKIRAQIGADMQHFSSSDNLQLQLKLLTTEGEDIFSNLETKINIQRRTSNLDTNTHL